MKSWKRCIDVIVSTKPQLCLPKTDAVIMNTCWFKALKENFNSKFFKIH